MFSMRHGFLLINKPKGPTSHDAVALVRNALHEPHIGHLGTLDPAATGLLVLAVGAKALKAIDLFQKLQKKYVATVCLGVVSSTYDGEGKMEEVHMPTDWQPPEEMALRRVIEQKFSGTIEQTPPAYSAVKVGGVRAYRRARQGVAITPAPRRIDIQECRILSYAYPELTLAITCGAGTYIRSLAHDLGQCLRCGGYLRDLRRMRVGEWRLENAVPPDAAAWSSVLPLKEVLGMFPRVELTAAEAEDIRHGKDIAREVQKNAIGWYDELPIVILEPARDGSRAAHPRKVL